MDLIVKESYKNLRLQKSLKIKINALPKGSVKKRVVGDKSYYYLAYREKGKVINKYIGDSKLEANEIYKVVTERRTYEKELKELQCDWQIYRKVGLSDIGFELKDVIKESAEGKNFNLSLRGFLDVFYANIHDKKIVVSMLRHEPNSFENIPDFQYAIIAATAHKLSGDLNLKVPLWVWKEKYYLKDMYFAGVGKTSLRVYNMLYSPPEFKHRNIFIDENILTRV